MHPSLHPAKKPTIQFGDLTSLMCGAIFCPFQKANLQQIIWPFQRPSTGIGQDGSVYDFSA